MQYLLFLFIILPLMELYLLIKIGVVIGAFNTIFLIVSTGVIGAYMARGQGLMILSKINHELSHGEMPSESMVDGLFVLVGGVLLITPGIVTDIAGFIFVIPETRKYIKKYLKKKFRYMARHHHTMDIRIDR